MRDVRHYTPNAEVTFFTEKGELVLRASNVPTSPIDNDVLSISTVRDMGADAPTFCITLSRRKEWHKVIGSNDLVKIEMVRPPELKALVMVGLVDDIRKSISLASDGTPQRVITVTGRGMAKAFINFNIGVVQDAGEYQVNVNDNFGWIDAATGVLTGQTPHAIIEQVWDTLGKENMKYSWSNSKTLFDEIKHILNGRDGVTLLDATSLVNWQGSMWAFFKEVGEAPFHELYWEVDVGVPAMILRPTPFSETPWNNLPMKTVTDDDIVMEELGRSDVETYTLFSVGCKALYSNGDTYNTLGLKPIWNKNYADKYGIRRYHTESAYTWMASEADTGTVIDVIKSMQGDIYDWNIKNNSMWNGTLIVKGSNTYKVGHKLQYKSTEDGSEQIYYIRSVSHNFVNFGSWVTQLGLTRGLADKDRFTPPYGEREEYQGIGMLNPMNPTPNEDGDGSDSSGDTSIDSGTAQDVVEGGRSLIGKVSYVFGGPGVEAGKADCSQYTQYCYKKWGGVSIGRTSDLQAKEGTLVNKADMQPGDLLIFKDTYRTGPSHVGIYSGNNKFLHNSSSRGVVEDDFSDYWKNKHYHSTRRVLTSSSGGGGGGGNNMDVTGGSYKVTVKMLTNTKCFTKSSTKNTWIVIHNTAGGSNASGIHSWFNGGAGGANTSTHYAVGDDGIMKMLEDSWKGKHTGSKPKSGDWLTNYNKGVKAADSGCGNGNSIGIEICDGGNQTSFKARVEKTIELTRFLMKKYDIPITRVVRHLDISGKPCPQYMIGTSFIGGKSPWFTWANFKDEIQLRDKNKVPVKVGTTSSDNSSNNSNNSNWSTTAKQLNTKLGGKLANHGQTFEDACKNQGISKYLKLVVAISQFETGNGTSNLVKTKNNVGGMYDSANKTFFKYKSIHEGINAHARNLKKNYIDKGLTTVEKIQKKYAPIGAGNDPNGLNKNWVNGVYSYLNKL